MYVIWNLSRRAYVARQGARSSFTPNLQNARTFATREAAERECCGDERVRSVSDIMES